MAAALAAILCSLAVPEALASTFVARGNEPSWQVEVGEDGIAFRTLNGETVSISPAPEPRVADDSRIYETVTGGKTFSLVIHDRICVDPMSGMPYPKTAAVVWGAATFSGCGGDPAELLHGEWRIVEIGGQAVLAGTKPTLTLEAGNRASGNATCNRLVGSYELTGESLTISALSLTRMLCERDLMEQETAIMRAFESVDRFDIDVERRLVLIGGDDRKIIARRELSP
jgi:heat shock protein HslJ